MPFLLSDQLDYRKALPTKARASSQCRKRPAYSRITMTKDSKYHNDMPTGLMTGRVEAGWLPPWRLYLSDLWEELIVWSKRHHFEWVWIRQHERHRENERCDALARAIVKLWRKSPGCDGVVEGGEDALRLVIKYQPKLFLHFIFRANLPAWLNIGCGFSPLP